MRKILIFGVLAILVVGGIYYWQEVRVKGISTINTWKTYVHDYPYFTQFQFSYPREFLLIGGNRLLSKFGGGSDTYSSYVNGKTIENTPVNKKIDALNEDLKVPLDDDIYHNDESRYKYFTIEAYGYGRTFDDWVRIDIDNDSEENQKIENSSVGTILRSDKYRFEEIIEVNGQKLLRRVQPHGLEGVYWDEVIFQDADGLQHILSTSFDLSYTLEYIKENKSQKLSPIFNQIVSSFKFKK